MTRQLLQCRYFEAGRCRSCALIETPYAQQLSAKELRCRALLSQAPAEAWLPAFSGGDRGFRNRAKLVVGGPGGTDGVTLGILGPDGVGIDLRECAIQAPQIAAVIPVLASFIERTGLEPYDVPNRRGELKFVHVTAAPESSAASGPAISLAGELMVRFVTRSERGLQILRSRLGELRELIPEASVISVNILPEHKAVLEGEREELLHGSTIEMRLGTVTLHLRPQSFFQTNTAVAQELYAQARAWIDDVSPRTVWDLYCGVGGFALHMAAPDRRVLGVEISPAAVESARRSAREAGLDAQFVAADATEFAIGADRTELPELIVVNPPRRGLGTELAGWLEGSEVDRIVYSSCNPESLVRDLGTMPSYRVLSARVFDMFPHTNHLEVAVLLERGRLS